MSALPTEAPTPPSPRAALSAGPLLVLGLGNPGPEYEQQRHNAGARVVTVLAQRLGTRLRAQRLPAWTGRALRGEREVVLARPRTYMNESGIAGARLLRELRLGLDQVLVVYDDLDLAVGRLRLRQAGSPGGHNGIRSLQSHWRSAEFARLRVGIGRPPPGMDPIDYVLDRPQGSEADELRRAEERAVDAVLTVVDRGLGAAMEEFNRLPQPLGEDGGG